MLRGKKSSDVVVFTDLSTRVYCPLARPDPPFSVLLGGEDVLPGLEDAPPEPLHVEGDAEEDGQHRHGLGKGIAMQSPHR